MIILSLLLASCGGATSLPSTTSETSETAPEGQPTSPGQEVEVPQLVDWFTPTQGILANWDVALDPADPSVVLISPKLEGETTAALFFLLTRGRPQFDRAIEVVLTTFLERGVIASAAIYFAPDADKDPSPGLVALEYAEANNYQLIYPVGSNATLFIFAHYQGGALPVVTLLSKDPVLLGQVPDYESGSGNNIAFTSVSVPVDLQMAYILELVPELENIAVLYESFNASTISTQVDPLIAYAEANGIHIIHLATTVQDDPDGTLTRAEIQSLFPDVMNQLQHNDSQANRSIILITASGSIVNAFDTVDALAGFYPVVSLLPDLVHEGEVSALMSVGVGFDSNSILAAVYGLRILVDGENPGTMPVGVITPPDLAINFAKAREIGLRIPFSLFESATFIYDSNGTLARAQGQTVSRP